MADIVDEATALIEAERDEGIRRVAAVLAAPGEAECVNCGDDIGASRRAAMPSAVRCISCQERAEKLGRIDMMGAGL